MNSQPLGAAMAIAAFSFSSIASGSILSSVPRLNFGALQPKPSGTLAQNASFAQSIQAGHPSPDPTTGILPDSPDLRIDPNTASSPFAGVGSIFADNDPSDDLGVICTGTPISRWTILTAAHCVDVVGGDGKVDVLPENFLFVLNYGGNFTHIIQAESIYVHPDYEGSASGRMNDDLAVIRLAEPLPVGVPIYKLADPNWLNIAPVIMVGYGTSGDGVNGYTEPPNFNDKRVGANLIESAELDDEGGPEVEIILSDFEYEGDPDRYDLLGIPFVFPNRVETTVGGGDSGGPAFMLNPDDISDDTLYLGGVNTFNFWIPGLADHDEPGKFGSGTGSIWLNAEYQAWILSIPETSTWFAGTTLLGMTALAGWLRRGRR